jgi:hypothetical protein
MFTGMKRILVWPRLRTLLVLCAACWLALGQLDGVLRSLQRGGVGDYGANAFGPLLSPRGLPEHVSDILALWSRDPTLAIATFSAYTVVDVLFIGAYTLLLLRLLDLLKRTGRYVIPLDGSTMPLQWLAHHAGALVLITAGADMLENILREVIVAGNWGPAPLVYAAWAATQVKWLALAVVVIVLVALWRAVGLSSGPGAITRDTIWALGRLRIPVVLLGAWGLFVIFDPTAQTADTFRRWFDDRETFATSAAFGFGTVLLLCAVTWTAVRRALLAGFAVSPKEPRWYLWLIALAVLAGGVLAGWKNLVGLAAVIALVFVAGGVEVLLRRWAARAEAKAVPVQGKAVAEPLTPAAARQRRMKAATERQVVLADAPEPGPLRELRRVARALSTWPLIALLLGLGSAWTAPGSVLLALGHDEGRAIPAAILAFAAFVAAGFVATAGPALLRAVEGERLPSKVEARYVAVALVCLAACAAAIGRPLDVPPAVGAVGMTSIGVAALLALLLEAQRYGDVHPPNPGLRLFGFARLPVVLLLLVAFGVASLANDGSYHAVARNDTGRPHQQGVTLQDAFAWWTGRNCADQQRGGDRTIPLVLVAGHGGGIRAAYWTTSVLTQLFAVPNTSARDAGCPRATAYDRVFAMSGASGGSLGAASYAGHPADSLGGVWYRRIWGTTDLVSVPVSWGLLVDLPRNLIGFAAPDRARRFEQAWERQDPTLRHDFFVGQGHRSPLLLLAGTQVESGCRMNVSRIRLTAPATLNTPAECAALAARTAAADDDRDATPARLSPSAAITSDVLDNLCGGNSINRSTAALLSARFPYVSPSGQLTGCGSKRSTAVVDGGYAENTGAQAALNLWARLEPLVAAHNARADLPRIVPIFVHVDNHYAKAARAGTVKRTSEAAVPPLAYLRTDKLDDRGVEQAANAAFSVALPGLPGTTCRVGLGVAQRYVRIAPTEHPGIQAPLAWTLSGMAMDDLDRQRGHAFSDPAPPDAFSPGGGRSAPQTLADVLHGHPLPCGGPGG